MPITNNFEVTDYTQSLLIIPNAWTYLTDSGLFTNEFLSTNTVSFDVQSMSLGLIGDKMRGEKPTANSDDVRKIRSYSIPHFPSVDALFPQDVQGVRAYTTNGATESDTYTAALARKLAKIRKSIDITKEVALFKTLTTGLGYAPNGTVSANFFADVGVSQTSVDFVLGTAGTSVISKCEAVIAAMQDNAAMGDVITGVIGYASPEFFGKLIEQANVKTAYTYYTATEGQMILRNRAGGMQSGLNREFTYGGIRFIEMRTLIGGATRPIPANECVFVPVGANDSFVTYYGPASRFDYVNTIAEEAYVWTMMDPKGEKISVDSETNFLPVLRRPQLVIKGTTSN